jgi:hypothetical protein
MSNNRANAARGTTGLFGVNPSSRRTLIASTRGALQVVARSNT